MAAFCPGVGGGGGVKVDATMFTIKRLICEACRSKDLW